jgi:VanZ family protein
MVVAWTVVILAITSWPGSAVPSPPTIPHVDKVLHAVLYGVLGWLVGRSWTRVSWRRWVGSLVAIAAFAAIDEWHQRLIEGRSADRYDWLADVLGAAGGMSLVRARERREHIV